MENKNIDVVYSYYDKERTSYYYPSTFFDRLEDVIKNNNLKLVKVLKYGFVNFYGYETIRVDYILEAK